MTRVITLLLALALAANARGAGARRQEPPVATPEVKQETPEFFSGVVRAISGNQITVYRKGLGSNSMRKIFSIDPETKIEGKPRVNGNVTVQYVAQEEGAARALHIIAR